MTSEQRLSDLLLQWEDYRFQGVVVDVEVLCAESPDLQRELERRIEALEALNPVLEVTPPWAATTAPVVRGPRRRDKMPSVPGYEGLGKVGEGGMGVVYKVRNVAIGRIEALKMMRAPLAPTPQVSQRFQKEIRATAHLEHPRIIRIYAAGEHENQPFFTMEFVSGGSLSQSLERFREDPAVAVALMARVARAVHFLHTKNIIHRDLKPANILLRDEEPLVSDFGLARFFDDDFETSGLTPSSADPNLTQSGMLMGTIAYMSPEQAEGHASKLTAASDVWALGVILYELLTGRRPFLDRDAEAIRRQITTTEPPRPRALQPRLDPNLEAICLGCLIKDPLRRYQSAEEVADHLERWLRGEPILPESWPRRAWRTVRMHPALATAAILFLCFGAVLGVLAARTRPDTPPRQLEPTAAELAAAAQSRLDATFGELKAGRLVTLIPPTGPPRWYSWFHGDTLDTVEKAADKPFAVHGENLSLVELLPQAPRRYRLRLEVHHDAGDGSGSVGIYFAASKKPTAEGVPVHCFCGFRFNDLVPPPKGEDSQARLSLHLVFPKGDRFAIRTAGLGVSALFQPAGLPQNKPWRTIEVVVAPEKINVTWEQQALKELPRAELDRMSQFLLGNSPVRPQEDPGFQPEEALGLFVHRGTGWFRSCTIEPLPSD